MRKLFAVLGAIVLAGAVALGSPSAAGAVEFRSPIGNQVTSPEGATAEVVATDESSANILSFESSEDVLVSKYKEPAAGGRYVGSFQIGMREAYGTGDLGLRVSVGEEYAGWKVSAYYATWLLGNGGPFADPKTTVVDEQGMFIIPFSAAHENSDQWELFWQFSINIEPGEAPVEDEKPISDTVKSDKGSSLTVYGDADTTGSIEGVVVTDKVASNYKAAADDVVLGSFEVEGNAEDFVLTFSVDKKYAGKTARLYVQHEDGSTEVLSQKIAEDGTVSFTMDRLSVYTLVVNEADGGSATIDGAEGPTADKKPVKQDTGAKSPQTGVRSAAEPAFAVAAIVAAGAALLISRKANGR